jgi:predicted kinase
VQESVATLRSPETRRAVIDLARTHGFTHVAIELPTDRRGAGERGTDAPLLRD